MRALLVALCVAASSHALASDALSLPGCPEVPGALLMSVRPTTLADRPRATQLIPIRAHPIADVVERLDETLAGRRANPAFRQPVAYARAYWSVAHFGIEPGPYAASEQSRSIRSVGLALAMAVEGVGRDMLDRSPVMSRIGDVLQSLYSPSLRLKRSSEGFRISGRPASLAGARNQRLAQARLLEEGDSAPTKTRRRPPRELTLGASLRPRGLDEDEDLPFVDGSVYVAARGVIVTAWRISALLSTRQWVATATQRLSRRLTATAVLRSAPGGWLPNAVTVGTLSPLRPLFPRAWQLRTYATLLASEDPPLEMRVGLVLRARWRWRAPFRPRAWFPGDRPGYPSAAPPPRPRLTVVQPDVDVAAAHAGPTRCTVSTGSTGR